MRKSKKNSSEPLEIHIDSPVSQKARQNQITYFKSRRKISLGGMNFWSPVMSFLGSKIRFQKRRKFSYFWLCPPAKLPKFAQWIWFSYICCISVTSTQRVLYLCISVTSNQRVKTVIFAEKNNFFSNVLTLNMYQTANLWTILLNFQCFFYLTNLKYLWKISLIWPICRNQKVKTVKNGGQDAFFMWHFQIH